MKILGLGVILLVVATGSIGQSLVDIIWDLGMQPYGEEGVCRKTGQNFPLPGFPVFDDPWFILLGTCKTLKGSISCQNEVDIGNGTLAGNCLCNQLDDQEYIPGEGCIGKVGALCTSEATSFIPQKDCGLFAHCIPEQGEGHSVGRCECLQGYTETDGKCVDDPAVPDKGTPRTTTTTEAPPKEDFVLPPLNLLIGMRSASYNEECNSGALLNRTFCNGMTVSCLQNRCQCNMAEDSIFDEYLGICVGRAGSYCLTRRNLFGYKACTDGADCFVEDGTDSKKMSFGTCKCLYGYDQQADGTCLRDPFVPNPSTKRPGGPKPKDPSTVIPITTPTTTSDPYTGEPTTGPTASDDPSDPTSSGEPGTEPGSTGTTPTGNTSPDDSTSTTTEAGASVADLNRLVVLIAVMSLALFGFTHP